MLLQHVVSEWYRDEKNTFLSFHMQGVPSPKLLVEQTQLSSRISQHVPILLRPPQQVGHDHPDLAQSITVMMTYDVVALAFKAKEQTEVVSDHLHDDSALILH